jgi:hypothetical protein
MSYHTVKISNTTDDPPRDILIRFFCPGCARSHVITGGEGGWEWNGDLEKPTIYPSIFAQGQIDCHSYIVDGFIRFLEDSTHYLWGQTVPLPPITIDDD